MRFLPLLLFASAAAFAAEPASPTRRLVILGDSLAAGYGVATGEGWPERLQEHVREAGLPYTVVNAGLSGDTTAGGLRRVDWVLRQPVDVLVIELGGNDGLRGLRPENTRTNLVGMVRKAREKWPDAAIVLAGMQMPTSMGRDYAESFRSVFPEVAKSERLHLIPHLLENVGGIPEVNLPDQVHPNPTGHRLVASNAWLTLKPLLLQRTGPVGAGK